MKYLKPYNNINKINESLDDNELESDIKKLKKLKIQLLDSLRNRIEKILSIYGDEFVVDLEGENIYVLDYDFDEPTEINVRKMKYDNGTTTFYGNIKDDSREYETSIYDIHSVEELHEIYVYLKNSPKVIEKITGNTLKQINAK